MPRKEPPVGDEAIGKPPLGQLSNDIGKEVRHERLAAGEHDLDRIEQVGGLVEDTANQLQIELLDRGLVRPTDAVGAMQVAEIGQLETDVHGQETGWGGAGITDRSPRLKTGGVTPLARRRIT
jgi:hypothetical protein